jgi:Inositol monophosphatase family
VSAGYLPDVSGGRLWLVDPLDGTREFLSRNGEFTVNIALVQDGRPVAGRKRPLSELKQPASAQARISSFEYPQLTAKQTPWQTLQSVRNQPHRAIVIPLGRCPLSHKSLSFFDFPNREFSPTDLCIQPYSVSGSFPWELGAPQDGRSTNRKTDHHDTIYTDGRARPK